MGIIAQEGLLLFGHNARVGWEISTGVSVYWCDSCNTFHFVSLLGARRVSSCQHLDDGASVAVLTCGEAPLSIRRAIPTGVLDPDAVEWLRWAREALEFLVSEAQR